MITPPNTPPELDEYTTTVADAIAQQGWRDRCRSPCTGRRWQQCQRGSYSLDGPPPDPVREQCAPLMGFSTEIGCSVMP